MAQNKTTYGHGDPLLSAAIGELDISCQETDCAETDANHSPVPSGHGDPLFQAKEKHALPPKPPHVSGINHGDPLMEATLKEWGPIKNVVGKTHREVAHSSFQYH
eukprot:3370090-Ditylum_brightwellii.AAC.1